jgi:predicted dehydrogenase
MALRVGVIGLGPIGNRHATLYKADELAELVGVCDINRERADAAAARLGVPVFYDAETMLKSLGPDVVSVTTGGVEYGSDHYEPTMQALSAGCHVLGEKPISNIVEEAEEMVAKAKSMGVCYGINLNHRFTPAARLAKQWIAEGRIGHQLFCRMSMWIMNPAESSPYYQIKALNPHTIDVMRYFCGDIEAVQLFATKAPGRKIAGAGGTCHLGWERAAASTCRATDCRSARSTATPVSWETAGASAGAARREGLGPADR